MPVVPATEHRLSLVVVAVATLWFAAVACWELFGPVLAGHYAASASLGIIADNMLRWDIIGPVWEYTAEAPTPNQYYCHHPWGTFWVTALAQKVLGRHDFVCRLPAVVLSSVTPTLLFLLGRALWRPAAGAIAAAAFVVTPISLSFANFNALEVPLIAWTTLGCWGFVRHQYTWKRRYLAASLAGWLMAVHSDWPAFVLIAVVLAVATLRGMLFRNTFGRFRLRPHVTWLILTAALCVMTVLTYAYLFHDADKLADLADSYRRRSRGSGSSLWAVLQSRRYWIELMFTPVTVALGVVAALALAVRIAWYARPLDAVPLSILTMATVQYVVFTQGASVHIFWPHCFAQFFALGMGALTATVLELAKASQDAPAHRSNRLFLVMGIAMFCLLVVLRDGVQVLGYARATGGRLNEKGLLVHSDGRKTAFLRWLAPQLPTHATVGMHEGMKTTWAQVWALGGRVVTPLSPPSRAQSVDAYLIDSRFMRATMLAATARNHHVTAVGPFWWIRSHETGPLQAFSITAREPSTWEWYFLSGTEPQRSITSDPFRTWELRNHFGQPAEAPSQNPQSFDQQRIAHNIIVNAGGDATVMRQRLQAQLTPPRTLFDDGTELLGIRYDDGVKPQLTLLFMAAGPASHDIMPAVRSRVVAGPRWSTTMGDPTIREVALPLDIAPIRWRAGYIYSQVVDIRKRPGTERFELYFELRGRNDNRPESRLPKLPSGDVSETVLTL